MFAFFPFSPPFLLFLQSDIKNMNLQLGKEKCLWLKDFFFFFPSGKPERLLGVCLCNLLFAVQNLGGKLQNVVWLQMSWCFAFLFFKGGKNTHITSMCFACGTASAWGKPWISFPATLMHLMCPRFGP